MPVERQRQHRPIQVHCCGEIGFDLRAALSVDLKETFDERLSRPS
jgi:hypothetical protein